MTIKGVGIANVGNSCYLNAMIHSVMSLESLVRKILAQDPDNFTQRGKMVNHLQSVITCYQAGVDEIDQIIPLIRETFDATLFSSKDRTSQEDSFDFFIALLNILDVNNFQMMNQKPTGNVSENFRFLDVALNENRSLEACLNHNFSMTDYGTQYFMKEFPRVLPIRLKRFGESLNRKIEVPEILVMSSYSKTPNEPADYSLKAVIVHWGEEINTGHYVCYRQIKGKWYLFDDANPVIEVKEPPLGEGYGFIYERID